MEPIEHLVPWRFVTKAENATDQNIDAAERYDEK
jgi:hypothetical protein